MKGKCRELYFSNLWDMKIFFSWLLKDGLKSIWWFYCPKSGLDPNTDQNSHLSNFVDPDPHHCFECFMLCGKQFLYLNRKKRKGVRRNPKWRLWRTLACSPSGRRQRTMKKPLKRWKKFFFRIIYVNTWLSSCLCTFLFGEKFLSLVWY